jgi:hypothetical protein
MSQENVENARRSYATLNEAYSQGDPNLFRLILEEMWARDAVFEPAGVLPDSRLRPHQGWDGVLHFIGNQMEAFSEGWVEADEFIDRGDFLIVPVSVWGMCKAHGTPSRVLLRAPDHAPRREGDPMRGAQDRGRSPRSRRAAGVGVRPFPGKERQRRPSGLRRFWRSRSTPSGSPGHEGFRRL